MSGSYPSFCALNPTFAYRPDFFGGSDVNGPSATRPSLSIGAGIGDLLRTVFPDYSPGAIVLLGMVAYFAGVV